MRKILLLAVFGLAGGMLHLPTQERLLNNDWQFEGAMQLADVWMNGHTWPNMRAGTPLLW